MAGFLTRALVFIRMALPWLWKAMVMAFELITLSFITYAKGALETVRTVADDWKRAAIVAGFPQVWQDRLYYLIYASAGCMNIIGLILLAHVVVIVVWWLIT